MYSRYNYHLSKTRILIENVFGRIKGRFKVLAGITDRKSHEQNKRMIVAVVVINNLLIDARDPYVVDVLGPQEAGKHANLAQLGHGQQQDETVGVSSSTD